MYLNILCVVQLTTIWWTTYDQIVVNCQSPLISYVKVLHYKKHVEFKGWLSMRSSKWTSVLFKDYLDSVYVNRKKGYPKFKNLTLHCFVINSLDFTSLELGFLHWHGVPACPQILPPCKDIILGCSVPLS